MKKKIEQRILLALFTAGFSYDEITQFCSWFYGLNRTDIKRFRMNFDMVIGNLADEIEYRSTESNTGSVKATKSKLVGRTTTRSRLSSNADVPEKVGILLRYEAGMSTNAAYVALKNELLQRYPGYQLPLIGKKPFESWVRLLLEFISPSELLHIATRIRNSSAHRIPKSDWPLR